MKTMHRLLATYTLIVVLFVILFSLTVYSGQPSSEDVFSMALSIAMLSLIPFGIILLLWRHKKR